MRLDTEKATRDETLVGQCDAHRGTAACGDVLDSPAL